MIRPISIAGLIILSVCFSDEGHQNYREQIFSYYYKMGAWGKNEQGEGHSGGGSTLAATIEYREFLQDFLETYKIKSVVDLGCGDWEFSKEINWKNIEYLGIDIVPFLIEKNQLKYGSPNIRFIHQDAVTSDLPSAELLISKDVLQHLSNQDLQSIIQQFKKYKYCLITNDIHTFTEWPDLTINSQIPAGGWRPVDLTIAPFFVNGIKILTYKTGQDIKQVLLIINSDN